MLSGYKYRIGQQLLIRRQAREPPEIGKVMYRSRESEKNVYDYEDYYGNFLWCYEENVIGMVILKNEKRA